MMSFAGIRPAKRTSVYPGGVPPIEMVSYDNF
ncbi:hypothetical protein SAMN05444158_2221 [Bradyrhizobium canariense]|uniref:Uncharacterized protein n=1 Tax=Bradyrhizobium canariense TaxID=255045 RepID=A0A1H1SMA5_9BRAD|nr:hypothetical protein SAMN05444158_2221 [Bradyrhizobium canariense]